MTRMVGVLVLVLAALLAFPATAYAGDPLQGEVVMGGSFTLESGKVLDGDLVVFGGIVELQPGSIVEGDVFLMGGRAELDGEVEGDLVMLGASAALGPKASIGGDAIALGGDLHRAQGSKIRGEIVSGDEFALPFDFSLPFAARVRPVDTLRFRFSPIPNLFWFGLRSLLVAALAILVVMFWPEPTARTARVMVSQPALSGGLGLLTIIVAPILLIVLAITIILSPVSLLAAVLLVVAGVFGWIAIGREVGDRLAKAFRWDVHPAAGAGLGTLVLSLVIGGIGQVPCIGWLGTFVVAAIGLGAVILTRFGARDYPPTPAPASTPAPLPEPVVEQLPKPKRSTAARKPPTKKKQ